MKATTLVPAIVPPGLLPLEADARDEMLYGISDLMSRYLIATANNRLKARDRKGNVQWNHVSDLAIWDLEEKGLRLEVSCDPGELEQPEKVVHWLELSWAIAEINHPQVTEFARPWSHLDVTIDLDPVQVARQTNNCSCGLCKWAVPRIEKWGAKRKSLTEVFRRIGRGEDVCAADILLMTGDARVKEAGRKPPKKSDMISAAEAKSWLALNPNRAF